MELLSGKTVECLFNNDSFLDAIVRKDINRIIVDIHQTCSFHIEAMLSTPVSKWLRTKKCDRFEKVTLQRTLEFDLEIEWLAETLVDMGLGVVPDAEINLEPLIHAIRQNRVSALKLYFWIGGRPDLKTQVDHINQRGGESLIHYAADLDDTSIMMFMIENGADINAKTFYGMETPMHKATMSGYKEMVRLLWGCGADINAPQCGGETALMIAANNSDQEMVYLLIRLGADVKVTNLNGQSASDLAIAREANEIFEMLSDREAGIKYQMIK